jgi:hypothetical protein
MTAHPSSAQRLTVENTMEVSRVGHRLALGIEWRDALTDLPVVGLWVSGLQKIGSRPIAQLFDLHPGGRHAVRLEGRIARILGRAAKEVPPADPALDPTTFALVAWGEAGPPVRGYSTSNDPRRYVPRRLSCTPVQTGGITTDTAGNVRGARVFPGAAYPLASNVSALRGRVRRGPSVATGTSVPWARAVVTRPTGAPDFDTETPLAWGHGDDRGEFLIVLGPNAATGAAQLPSVLALRLWVFLPPAGAFDPLSPLASLPLEFAGTAATNAVLQGTQLPSTYTRAGHIDVNLRPGRTLTLADVDLLFP